MTTQGRTLGYTGTNWGNPYNLFRGNGQSVAGLSPLQAAQLLPEAGQNGGDATGPDNPGGNPGGFGLPGAVADIAGTIAGQATGMPGVNTAVSGVLGRGISERDVAKSILGTVANINPITAIPSFFSEIGKFAGVIDRSLLDFVIDKLGPISMMSPTQMAINNSQEQENELDAMMGFSIDAALDAAQARATNDDDEGYGSVMGRDNPSDIDAGREGDSGPNGDPGPSGTGNNGNAAEGAPGGGPSDNDSNSSGTTGGGDGDFARGGLAKYHKERKAKLKSKPVGSVLQQVKLGGKRHGL